MKRGPKDFDFERSFSGFLILALACLMLCCLTRRADAEIKSKTLTWATLISDAVDIFTSKVESGESKPISLDLVIGDAVDVDETTQKQKLSFHIQVKLSWKNANLTHHGGITPKRLNPDDYTRVKPPDVYVDIMGTNILHPPLSNDAEEIVVRGVNVTYTGRTKAPSLHCEQDFSWYPADVHKCVAFIKARTTDTGYHLNWTGPSAIQYLGKQCNQNHHVQVDHEIFYSVPTNYLAGMVTATITFHVRRKIGHHILQTYLPSGLLVILAWLGLFIPVEGSSERFTLLVTTLLSLHALFGSVDHVTTPSVSYVKALDVWMFACFFVVFLTLVQSIMVLNLAKGYIREKVVDPERLARLKNLPNKKTLKMYFRKRRERLYNVNPTNQINAEIRLEHSQAKMQMSEREDARGDQDHFPMAKKIDRLARTMIMILFIAFTLCYVIVVFGDRFI